MNPINKIPHFQLLEKDLYTTLEKHSGAPYDDKARAYEKMVGSKVYNKIMWGTLPADYIQFSHKAILDSKGNCLDIGCGGLVQTAKQYADAQANFVLLDNSVEMLRVGKQRLEALCGNKPSNIHFLQSDAFNLPFEDNSFDTVCSFGVLHIFDNKKQFVKEAIRVLKPGGKFFISALVTDRRFSRFYINFLKKKGVFGEPIDAQAVLELLRANQLSPEWYIKGSMIFMSGLKPKK